MHGGGTALIRQVKTELRPIAHDRRRIAEVFSELSELVSATQSQQSEIRNRSWWDKIWANNTRDLADAMGSVVRIQQYSFAVMMALVELNARNVRMLGVLRSELTDLRADLGLAANTCDENADAIEAVTGTVDSVLRVVEQKIEEQRERNTSGGTANGWSPAQVALATIGALIVLLLIVLVVRP